MSRAQALENRAFLKVLRRLGNVRLACRELGLKYGTMQDRRRKHPAFALRWEAALVFAQPRLKAGVPSRTKSGTAAEGGFRTVGGEPVVVRLKNGRLQMRRAQPGKLTREAEQAFLAALSATCNMRLSAAAVGAAFNAFNRRRKQDPAFDREVRLALKRGWAALEGELLASGLAGSHEHDDWRHNEPPAVPPMSVGQALQLLYLHQKAALLVDEPTPMRRRRGESNEARNERLALMAEARAQRARDEFDAAEAERRERGERTPLLDAERRMMGLPPHPAEAPLESPSPSRGEGNATGLPDLAQVTGWSRADPAKAADPGARALFGGWRIEEMEAQRERALPRVRRL